MADSVWFNQLEPESLLQAFLTHPPEGFYIRPSSLGVPLFEANFDLLTTVEAPLRQRVMGLPFYGWWGRWLKPRTCFVGSTVSEYVIFPKGETSALLMAQLRKSVAPHFPFLIIKDIPQQSPLLDTRANGYAEALVTNAKQTGFVMVEGQALAWVPIDFTSEDEYLEHLSAGRRKDIRRKLRKRENLEISELATGSNVFNDAAVLDEYYRLYLNVFAQSEIHFDKLTREFFMAILQDSSNGGVVFTYRLAGRLIGYNLCFCHDGRLVDKYIGLEYPEARENNLYFVSWFHNLDYARRRGLSQYVAGWTDPEVKASLGAQFTFTRHAVFIRNPLLRIILQRLSSLFESDRKWREEYEREKA